MDREREREEKKKKKKKKKRTRAEKRRKKEEEKQGEGGAEPRTPPLAAHQDDQAGLESCPSIVRAVAFVPRESAALECRDPERIVPPVICCVCKDVRDQREVNSAVAGTMLQLSCEVQK